MTIMERRDKTAVTPALVLGCGQSGVLLVRDQDVATPALLCHKEPAPIIGPFLAWKPPIPYAIKNQRGASKMGVFCVPKPQIGVLDATSWFFMA